MTAKSLIFEIASEMKCDHADFQKYVDILDENLLLAEVGTEKKILIIGDAASKAPQWLKHGVFTFQEVHLNASMLVAQSWHKFEAETFSDLAYTIPFYLKPPNIVTSKKKYFQEYKYKFD